MRSLVALSWFAESERGRYNGTMESAVAGPAIFMRGTGHLYEKYGSYYGRWRTLDGRLLNRLIGPVRTPGESDGLTRSQAERAFRKLQEAGESSPRPVRGASVPSLDDLTDSLRRRLAVRGARRSYLEGCESVQRVHLSHGWARRR
jgi:hypothetical protein